MTLYDLAICVTDEQDLASGHKRKKEGDVIACRLHSETTRLGGWGTKELPSHLMVTVDISDEDVKNLMIPQYDDGSFGETSQGMYDLPTSETWLQDNLYEESITINEFDKLFYITTELSGGQYSGSIKPDFENANIGDILVDGDITWKCSSIVTVFEHIQNKVFNVGDAVIDSKWVYLCTVGGMSGSSKPSFVKEYEALIIDNEVTWKCIGNTEAVIEGKRRYSLPFNILVDGWKPDMDLAKVRDKNQVYQPFIDENIIIDAFEEVSLIKDKKKGTFKYPTKKIKE